MNNCVGAFTLFVALVLWVVRVSCNFVPGTFTVGGVEADMHVPAAASNPSDRPNTRSSSPAATVTTSGVFDAANFEQL